MKRWKWILSISLMVLMAGNVYALSPRQSEVIEAPWIFYQTQTFKGDVNVEGTLTANGVPVLGGMITSGNVFYVDSGAGYDNVAYGRLPSRPYATLDYAIGQCTASNGDVIFILPGHSETLTGATAVVLDIAGITVIGLGRGADRPTFLLDGSAAVDIDVSAADVKIQNCIFKAGHADIVKCFDLTAKGFTLEAVEIQENVATENFLQVILTNTTDNSADRLTLINCKYVGPDTSNTNFIDFNGDCDSFTMIGCYVSMGVNDNNAICGVATGKDLTNVRVMYNQFYRLNTAGDIVFDSDTTANSGIVAYNVIGHADTDAEVLFDITGARLFENYGTAVNDTSGFLRPAADS